MRQIHPRVRPTVSSDDEFHYHVALLLGQPGWEIEQEGRVLRHSATDLWLEYDTAGVLFGVADQPYGVLDSAGYLTDAISNRYGAFYQKSVEELAVAVKLSLTDIPPKPEEFDDQW